MTLWLGEFRLGTYFAMRVAPAMYFGTKHFTFHNHKETLEDGKPIEQRQELKTAYVSCAFDLIFSAKRFNNHRPYMMLGLNPMLNLSNKDDDYLKMKKYDFFRFFERPIFAVLFGIFAILLIYTIVSYFIGKSKANKQQAVTK